MFARAFTFVHKTLTRSVSARLAGGYVVLIAMILLVVGLGLMNFHTLRGTYDEVLDTRLPRIAQLQKIQADLAALSITAHAAMLTEDKALLEKSLASVDTGRLQMGEQLEALQKALEAENTELSKATAQGVSDRASGVLVGLVKFSRMLKAGKHEMAADSLRNGLQPELEKLGLLIGEYEKSQMTSLAAVKDSVAELEKAITQRSIAIALAAIAVASGFGFWIVRSVVAPLQRATRVARLMAQGNFSKRLTVGRFDEVGKVTSAFNEISDGMTDLVDLIRSEAAQIDSVTHNISERNAQLESGAQDLTVGSSGISL